MTRLDARLIGAAALLPRASAPAADALRPPRPPPLLVRPRPIRRPAAPLAFTVVAGGPTRVLRVPHAIGPDGAHDERGDLVRSIDGAPCGQDGTHRALARWGYAPAD